MQHSQENTCGGFIKKKIQHKSFLANIAKLLRTLILKNICERLLLAIKYWASADLSLTKNNVEWFLLRRAVNLVTVFLLIIIWNHSNTFLLTCRKQKLVQTKILQQRLFLLMTGFWQVETGCCPLLNVYFNDMQINSRPNF